MSNNKIETETACSGIGLDMQSPRRETISVLKKTMEEDNLFEDELYMTEKEMEDNLELGMRSLKIPHVLDLEEDDQDTPEEIPTVSFFELSLNRTLPLTLLEKAREFTRQILEPSFTSRISIRVFRSIEAIKQEKNRQKQENPFIIHPFSEFRWYWDMIMIVTLVITMIYLPIEIAFYSDSANEASWKAINILVDLIFLIDIFFNFRTGYLHSSTEEVILHNKCIVVNYLKTWFVIDLVSSVPFDYMYMEAVGERGDSNTNIYMTLRVLRLMKMLSLLRVLRLARLWRYINKFEEILDIDTKVVSAFNLVLLMIMYCHWNGCVQYLVALVEDFPTDSWAYDIKLNETDITMGMRYAHSMFRAMSHMMSIGYGLTPPTRISDIVVVIFSMALGGTFYALFIGHLSRIILAMDSSGRRYEEKLSEVKEYLRFRRMPMTIQEKVIEYYEHKYQRKFFDEHRIIQEPSMSDPLRRKPVPEEKSTHYLSVCSMTAISQSFIPGATSSYPDALKELMVMHNCRNLVEKVPFLNSAPADFLYDIICKLQFQVYFPGDIVVEAGRKGDCMYFIEHGSVEIILKNGECVQTLGDGTHFGEISLLLKERRVASVVAKGMCDCYRLTKTSFDEVLADYPKMRTVLEKIAKQRLSQTRKESECVVEKKPGQKPMILTTSEAKLVPGFPSVEEGVEAEPDNLPCVDA